MTRVPAFHSSNRFRRSLAVVPVVVAMVAHLLLSGLFSLDAWRAAQGAPSAHHEHVHAGSHARAEHPRHHHGSAAGVPEMPAGAHGHGLAHAHGALPAGGDDQPHPHAGHAKSACEAVCGYAAVLPAVPAVLALGPSEPPPDWLPPRYSGPATLPPRRPPRA